MRGQAEQEEGVPVQDEGRGGSHGYYLEKEQTSGSGRTYVGYD
jgi:hypothetical protein